MTQPKNGAGKTCFVVMPVSTPAFYAESFSDPEHFPHVLTHLFCPALEELGFSVIPPSARGAELIHAEIIRNLEQADLVLCDLSSLNPNVFFELGVRTSLDRPVVLVRDNLTLQIPFDLNAVNTLTYDASLMPWTLPGEVAQLTAHIKMVIDSDSPGNSMWRYFGLTKRGEPSRAGENPIEAKLDFLINEIQNSQRTPLLTYNKQRMAQAMINQAAHSRDIGNFSLRINETDSTLTMEFNEYWPLAAEDRAYLVRVAADAGYGINILMPPPRKASLSAERE